MHVPQSPDFLRDLDLMRRLDTYANGNATWHNDDRALGQRERAACQQLYANLSNFVERCLHTHAMPAGKFSLRGPKYRCCQEFRK